MNNSNYNLQILHHEEVFATRELALQYLSDYYKPHSLEAEPIMVKYGQASKPDVILAFGTTSAAPGGFYAIDMTKANEEIAEIAETIDTDKEEIATISELLNGVIKATGLIVDENKINDKVIYDVDKLDPIIGEAVDIAQAVDLLAKYARNNDIEVEDSNAIRLIYEVNPDGGKKLKAEIILSTDGDSDELGFNNNIIGVKNDGIYAASHLAYDDARHELIFTTSGYKNGRFQDDAIVQRINLGQHTKLIADNENHTVKLIINDEEDYGTKLSADVQISSVDDNILEVKENKLAVIGRADKIKYGDSTVKDTLDEYQTRLDNLNSEVNIEGVETNTTKTIVEGTSNGKRISSNVKLDADGSINISGEGLFADIDVSVNVATNTLTFKKGNLTREMQLPGASLFERAEYDAEHEELIIYLSDGGEVHIPITSFIHTWTTDNTGTPIELIKTINIGGNDTLTAKIKLRHDADNLITDTNNELSVSKNTIDNLITEKVNAEKERAMTAEANTQSQVTTLNTQVSEQGVNLRDLTERVNSEIQRAQSVENTIDTIAREAKTLAEDANASATTALSEIALITDDLTEAETALSDLSAEVEANKTDADTKFTQVNERVTTNASAISNLEAHLHDADFTTSDTDTISMSLSEGQRVLRSYLKIKNSEANIIKNDANGVYANVTLEYVPETNKLIFNNGNDSKTFQLIDNVSLDYNTSTNELIFTNGNHTDRYQLENFEVLQSADYDAVNQQIVLIFSLKDGDFKRVVIPLTGLIIPSSEVRVNNTGLSGVNLSVVSTTEDNKKIYTLSASSTIPEVEIKLDEPMGSTVDLNLNETVSDNKKIYTLSADTKISNADRNLLKSYSNGLYASSDASLHYAEWRGQTSNVQLALDDINDRFNTIEDYGRRIDAIEETIATYDARIASAEAKAEEAKTIAEGVQASLADILARLEAVEQWVENAVDFGEYNTNTGGNGE